MCQGEHVLVDGSGLGGMCAYHFQGTFSSYFGIYIHKHTFGCHDIQVLGKSHKMEVTSHMTIAVDWDTKADLKKISVCRHLTDPPKLPLPKRFY